MSDQLVIVETGEIVTMMTVIEAERVTTQIANHLDDIANHLELVMPLIADALTRGAWQVLGYASPTAYTEERFNGALSRLPINARVGVVRELTEAGMSTRAIAPVVGVSNKTVHGDLHVLPEVTPAPEPEPEIIEDPAPTPQPEWTSASTTLAAMTDTTEHGLPKSDTVIGRDGKHYQRPVKKPSETAEEILAAHPETKPKRRPITDTFWEAAYDIDQLANKLHKLTTDDRFTANRQAISDKNLRTLKETASTLAQVLAAIETN